VEGSNESFVEAIRLPLTMAARIEIIDPWLLPTKDRSAGLLGICLQSLGAAKSEEASRLKRALQTPFIVLIGKRVRPAGLSLELI
jgi:hypothetical protein